MAKKGYTTQDDIENAILQDIDASFSDNIDMLISSVERYIDATTGRNFIADEEASARYYDGDGEDELLIDECIEVTKVEAGEDSYGATFTEIASTGANRYFLDPPNAAAKGLPFYKVTLNARTWPEGKQNQRITAKWGYSKAVPDDIKFVATTLVAAILNTQRGGGGDIVKSERIGNYTVTFNNDQNDSLTDFNRALEILDTYKRQLL